MSKTLCKDSLAQRQDELRLTPNSIQAGSVLTKLATSVSKSKPRSAVTCCKCDGEIADEYVMKVAQQFWHADCLRCTKCGQRLVQSCFVKAGKLYCASDYSREKSNYCFGCHELLCESRLIQKAGEYTYHLECFCCVICRQQLNKGDEFYLIEESFSLICKLDYETNRYRDLDGGSKRPRTTISSGQLLALQEAYSHCNKPPRHVRERLSIQTGLDMRVVQVWFQNRRAKERRLSRQLDVQDPSSNNPLDGMMASPVSPYHRTHLS